MVRPSIPPAERRARETAKWIVERVGKAPRVALLLGTGHASIAERLTGTRTIAPRELPAGLSFAHDSPLLCGMLHGVSVVVSGAGLPCYEGHSVRDAAYPVRVLRAMGADILVLSAGAASLSAQIEPGAIGLVADHLDFSGTRPLQGPPEDHGPRFLDMTEPYARHLRQVVHGIALRHGIPCAEAVFAAVPGPALPTRAEYRFLHRAGADLVGMSLVPEVMVARYVGFDVVALVGVTQRISLESPTPPSIEAMLDAADLAEPRMTSILVELVASLGPDGG